MRILIAADAWHPQIDGVVRVLTMILQICDGKTDGQEKNAIFSA